MCSPLALPSCFAVGPDAHHLFFGDRKTFSSLQYQEDRFSKSLVGHGESYASEKDLDNILIQGQFETLGPMPRAHENGWPFWEYTALLENTWQNGKFKLEVMKKFTFVKISLFIFCYCVIHILWFQVAKQGATKVKVFF